MEIIAYPHPTLRHKSQSVKRVDAALHEVVREMFSLMYEAKGIGLAANQVDLPLRLFIVNLAALPGEGEELVFINPVLSRPKGAEEAEEGCLSLPGIYGPVIRPATVRVDAYNLAGEEVQADLQGMLSRVVQHELDHLDGVLFPDRMSSTGKMAIQPELDEMVSKYQMRLGAGEIPDESQIAEHRRKWQAEYC